MVVDIFFLAISIIFCIPTAQLILDALYDHTDILDCFDLYGASSLIDWIRDDEGLGPYFLGCLYLCMSLGMYLIKPMYHAVQVSFCTCWLLWSSHKLNKKMGVLQEVLKNGTQKCHKHPDVTLAICVDTDGTVTTICYKCEPEKAKEFGITEGEDEEENN